MARWEFVFTPGLWLGEGKITFSSSSDFLKFYTKWEVSYFVEGMIKAVQTVVISGVEENLINQFTFSDITADTFNLTLENNIIGNISGKGIRNGKIIAWEFRGQSTFEGFETYEQQENGDYFLHAEYGSPDQFRTIVEGLIWPKEGSY